MREFTHTHVHILPYWKQRTRVCHSSSAAQIACILIIWLPSRLILSTHCACIAHISTLVFSLLAPQSITCMLTSSLTSLLFSSLLLSAGTCLSHHKRVWMERQVVVFHNTEIVSGNIRQESAQIHTGKCSAKYKVSMLVLPALGLCVIVALQIELFFSFVNKCHVLRL